MIAGTMAYALLVTALMVLAALGVEGILRGWGKPVRWVWAAAMAGSIILPGIHLLSPATAPCAEPTPSCFSETEGGGATGLGEGSAGAVVGLTASAASDDQPSLLARGEEFWSAALEIPGRLPQVAAELVAATPGADRGLALLWILLGSAFLFLLLRSARRLHRRVRSLPVRTVEGREVAVAELLGPAVVGVVRPQIILPRWLLSASHEAISMTVAHEEEHLRARDTLLLAAGLGAIVLFPWNPILWFQLHRLRLAIELDCDRRVVRRGVVRTRYASVLLEVGSRSHPLAPAALALTEPQTFLERRMKALCSPRPRTSLLRASLAGTLALLFVAVACDMPRPDPTVADSTEPSPISTVAPSVSEVPVAVVDMGTEEAADGEVGALREEVARLRWELAEERGEEVAQSGGGLVFRTDGTTVLEGDWISGDRLQSTDEALAEALRAQEEDRRRLSEESQRRLDEARAAPTPRAEDFDLSGVPARAREATSVDATVPFLPAALEEQPRLINAQEAASLLERYYPRDLLDASVSGRVTVQFIITADGRVNPSTIRIVNATHEAFAEATANAIQGFRFSPGRYQGQAVQTFIEMPIDWTAR